MRLAFGGPEPAIGEPPATQALSGSVSPRLGNKAVLSRCLRVWVGAGGSKNKGTMDPFF